MERETPQPAGCVGFEPVRVSSSARRNPSDARLRETLRAGGATYVGTGCPRDPRVARSPSSTSPHRSHGAGRAARRASAPRRSSPRRSRCSPPRSACISSCFASPVYIKTRTEIGAVFLSAAVDLRPLFGFATMLTISPLTRPRRRACATRRTCRRRAWSNFDCPIRFSENHEIVPAAKPISDRAEAIDVTGGRRDRHEPGDHAVDRRYRAGLPSRTFENQSARSRPVVARLVFITAAAASALAS